MVLGHILEGRYPGQNIEGHNLSKDITYKGHNLEWPQRRMGNNLEGSQPGRDTT